VVGVSAKPSLAFIVDVNDRFTEIPLEANPGIFNRRPSIESIVVEKNPRRAKTTRREDTVSITHR
jgi:hypothetical protein